MIKRGIHRILDIFRRITGMFYALRRLDALLCGMDVLRADMQEMKAKINEVKLQSNELKAGLAFLAATHEQSETASGLVAASYETRALFLKELFSKNWEFLLSSWTKVSNSGPYLDVDGVFITADFSGTSVVDTIDIFTRTFFIYLFFNDMYDRDIVIPVEQVIRHVRQYRDDAIDVRIKPGDIVIDAGAWIGDFSAYAAKQGATVHAFEPTSSTYELLLRTVALNTPHIIPVMKALGAENGPVGFGLNVGCSAGNQILRDDVNWWEDKNIHASSVDAITLDTYVQEQNLSHVDFIKADIEGGEELLLAGATTTLRKFAPKLSIATYHAANDSKLIQKIISAANPTYKFVQCRSVLFGAGKPMAA